MRSFRIGNNRVDFLKLDSNNIHQIQKLTGELALELMFAGIRKDKGSINRYSTLLEIALRFLIQANEVNMQFSKADLANVLKNKHTPEGKLFEKSLRKIGRQSYELNESSVTVNPYALFAPCLNAIKRGNFNLNHVERAEEPEVQPERPSFRGL